MSPLIHYLSYKLNEASHVTHYDRALIEAQWIGSMDTDFQCHKKADKQSKAYNISLEESLQRVRVSHNCDHKKLTLDSGYEYDRCFCYYKHPQFFALINLWNAYKKGHQVYAGSILEYPCFLIEFFDLFDSLQADTEETEQKKAEQKSKRKKGKK